jgi:cell division protein FtsN
VVFPIVAALLLAGVGAWLFFFKDKGEAPESSSQVETAKLEPSQPEGTPSSPASQAPQGSPGEPSKPSPDQNAGQSAADPSKAPSKEAGQKKLTPVDEARKLLREGAPEAELVAAVKRLDGQPGAEDAVFIILRKLAPSSPEYRMRFAAFYDPLDTRPAGSVPKNAKHAYDEYEEAKKAGVKSAADRQDALLEWAEAREGSADEGVRELLRVLDKDLF